MTIKTPYAPSHGVNIPNLDPFFGPDAPPLPDPEPMPDAMQQNPHILYVMQILADVLTDRLDTFADTNTIVYYDPTDRNRRLQPDVYVAFDVDADAIRRRNGYLIWEVGKRPDFVLEVASESTASHDTGNKRDLYARVGVGEYWRFDASGGEMYEAPLLGRVLGGRSLPRVPDQHRRRRSGLGLQPPIAVEPALEQRRGRAAGPRHRGDSPGPAWGAPGDGGRAAGEVRGPTRTGIR